MKTIGIFAGSFNPWHEGHQDILDQAKLIFEEVIVIRGLNPGKTMMNFEDGSKIINWTYRGLLTDQLLDIQKSRGCSVVLIRGLRGIKDLEYEEEQLYWLRKLKPDLKHVFIMCNLENKFISSSAIRTLKQYNK